MRRTWPHHSVRDRETSAFGCALTLSTFAAIARRSPLKAARQGLYGQMDGSSDCQAFASPSPLTDAVCAISLLVSCD